MKDNDLIDAIRALCPCATLSVDDDGQIIINTNKCYDDYNDEDYCNIKEMPEIEKLY
jgi:hypothetical protein